MASRPQFRPPIFIVPALLYRHDVTINFNSSNTTCVVTVFVGTHFDPNVEELFPR